ncbi:zinc finger Ran-binding domain-containing protein [Pandoraea sputorum]|uniref:zinc finger Ran-binding domain-containing protein n=1 Tax=Pandoraea sputorum TaxID=93222 RepID=UPI001E5E65F2|nr:zinc finger Ran-binding domain-containing protein [Pandoraea sputorum]MCE4061494.1 zinc finger Ran-binding domain-containing protein [Pandoraea sputorum]
MQCPTCGTNNATRALHCVKCGATLADAEPGFLPDDGLSVAAVGAMPEMRSSAEHGAAPSDIPPSRKPTRLERGARRARGEEPGWLNSALVIGTAVFAAIALLGIWWNLRAPFVDPVPKPPGGIAVTPFNSGNYAPLASSPVAGAASEASAALARAQALAAVDAAASGAAAEIAATTAGGGAPLTASAATAALTAAATSPSTVSPNNAQDPMMQLLSRSEAAAGTSAPPRAAANADLPAHFDNDDIGAIAAAQQAQGQSEVASTAVASAPTAQMAQTAAATIAAALAQCDRYRWFEVIPKQRCIWAVCNGRWGRDGCPAGTNPGESR